jgi:hypothetical protein
MVETSKPMNGLNFSSIHIFVKLQSNWSRYILYQAGFHHEFLPGEISRGMGDDGELMKTNDNDCCSCFSVFDANRSSSNH